MCSQEECEECVEIGSVLSKISTVIGTSRNSTMKFQKQNYWEINIMSLSGEMMTLLSYCTPRLVCLY